MPDNDPNAHIANFLEICDAFKHNRVSPDAIRLRRFPFTQRQGKESITTWEALAQKFLAKYFPPTKTAKLRNDITSFMQYNSESLYEAWERYTKLLRKYPHHGLPKWLQVQTFYNGLTGFLRSTIDTAACGAFIGKSIDEAYDLLVEIASNNY